ncbi:uncharacterized protein YjiS (DUF1127 family) [Rubricella aquisinus]|uniref:Uncharacterized protein YjiS (DUF1127 family) n=1 Tax=Rubricella aquisinus TaxID=2028108 RepID=A0A840X4X1_9RHOB|nr:DUF1127 domain-containing protein [Rubricella aquisinus]MBB5516846.1 uncharacterized protein YjiS (DUF1127 family) [Rubricella aquisinus]
MAFISANAPAHHGIVARIAAYAAEQRTAFSKWMMYRRTVRELSQLSAHELDDLGLNRGSIHATAYDVVYNAK